MEPGSGGDRPFGSAVVVLQGANPGEALVARFRLVGHDRHVADLPARSRRLAVAWRCAPGTASMAAASGSAPMQLTIPL